MKEIWPSDDKIDVRKEHEVQNGRELLKYGIKLGMKFTKEKAFTLTIMNSKYEGCE